MVITKSNSCYQYEGMIDNWQANHLKGTKVSILVSRIFVTTLFALCEFLCIEFHDK